MPTSKPIVTFAVEPDILNEIQVYQHTNFIKSQSKAIVSLLKLGLNRYNPEYDYSDYEKDIIKKYRSLDDFGKEAVLGLLEKGKRKELFKERMITNERI